jgi:hypothetical protein
MLQVDSRGRGFEIMTRSNKTTIERCKLRPPKQQLPLMRVVQAVTSLAKGNGKSSKGTDHFLGHSGSRFSHSVGTCRSFAKRQKVARILECARIDLVCNRASECGQSGL